VIAHQSAESWHHAREKDAAFWRGFKVGAFTYFVAFGVVWGFFDCFGW
jgi:hypothetical protein